ncbi:hypothetical protein P8452_29812 [Trifolium repens]|nr:hypothetical protein P8452_29812 [Trifolium repens]
MANKNDKTTEAASNEVEEMDGDAAKAKTIEALKKAQTIEDLMVDKKSAKLAKQLVAALKEGNESKMNVDAGVEGCTDSDLEAEVGLARFEEPIFGELSSDGYCTIS